MTARGLPVGGDRQPGAPDGDVIFIDGTVIRKFEENGRKLVEVQATAEHQVFDEAQLARMIALARAGVQSLIAKQQAILSVLTLRQIRAMVDDLITAHGDAMPLGIRDRRAPAALVAE